jgi:hypothetical protein
MAAVVAGKHGEHTVLLLVLLLPGGGPKGMTRSLTKPLFVHIRKVARTSDVRQATTI